MVHVISCLLQQKKLISVLFSDVLMMEWIARLLLIFLLMNFSSTLPDVIPIGKYINEKTYYRKLISCSFFKNHNFPIIMYE